VGAARSLLRCFHRYGLCRSPRGLDDRSWQPPPLLQQTQLLLRLRVPGSVAILGLDICLHTPGEATRHSARLFPGNCSPVPTLNCTWSRLKRQYGVQLRCPKPCRKHGKLALRRSIPLLCSAHRTWSLASTRLDLSLYFSCFITPLNT
jgi:hypothetical protein